MVLTGTAVWESFLKPQVWPIERKVKSLVGWSSAMASDRNLKGWSALRVQMRLEGCGGNKEGVKSVCDQAKWFYDFAKGNPTADCWQAVKSVLPSTTWFPHLLAPLMFFLLLLFGPYLFNLLVRFVSSRLQQFLMKTMVLLGFKLVPSNRNHAGRRAWPLRLDW